MTHLEIAHICNYSTIYRQRCISIIHFISRSFFSFFSSYRVFSNPIIATFLAAFLSFPRRRRRKNVNSLVFWHQSARNGAQGVERDQTRKIAGLRGKVRGTHHLRVGFAHSDSQSERSWRWKRGRASDRCTNGKIIDIYINRDVRVRNCISFRFWD